MEHRPSDTERIAVMDSGPGRWPSRNDGGGAPFLLNPRAPILPLPAARPAMAINGRRNKPIGPGGSTRRLHRCNSCVSSPIKVGPVLFVRMDLRAAPAGPKQDRRGRKGRAFARYGTAVMDQSIVANDNYAPVAQAA